MTRAEAIEAITIAQAQVEWDYPLDFAAAFDTAIYSLQGWDLAIDYLQKARIKCNGGSNWCEGYRKGIYDALAIIKMVLENEVDDE